MGSQFSFDIFWRFSGYCSPQTLFILTAIETRASLGSLCLTKRTFAKNFQNGFHFMLARCSNYSNFERIAEPFQRNLTNNSNRTRLDNAGFIFRLIQYVTMNDSWTRIYLERYNHCLCTPVISRYHWNLYSIVQQFGDIYILYDYLRAGVDVVFIDQRWACKKD